MTGRAYAATFNIKFSTMLSNISSESITVSIVSHGQGKLIAPLLQDLSRCSSVAKIIVTQNIPEPTIHFPAEIEKRLIFLHNEQPLGFASNHNQAYSHCSTPYFAVLNPDIRLIDEPFLPLLDAMRMTQAAMIAPSVISPEGILEDSVRHFPTFLNLAVKMLRLNDGRYVIQGNEPRPIDWSAGMFMLFQAEAFNKVGGFDEGFFLYYEDVDICARLWKQRLRVIVHPGVTVIHSAQRASRRNLRYTMWHLSSMTRYFAKHLGRLPQHIA